MAQLVEVRLEIELPQDNGLLVLDSQPAKSVCCFLVQDTLPGTAYTTGSTLEDRNLSIKKTTSISKSDVTVY